MVKVKLYTGHEWSLSRITKTNIDIIAYDLARSEMDLVIIIDGYEGTGKSFMARGIARYLATILRKYFPNTTFGVDDITFSTQQYVDGSVSHGSPLKKSAVKINVLDEGRHALNRKSSTSKGNKIFTNYLSECRAMQQVHIILAPAFHDLDKNIVLWRTSAILHTLKNYVPSKESPTGHELKRGRFHLYTNKKDIARQYFFPYNYPTHNEDSSTWSCVEVFTKEELIAYNEKKYKATIEKYHSQNNEELMKENPDPETKMIKASVVANALGLSTMGIRRMVERGEVEGRKIGKFWYITDLSLKKEFNMEFSQFSNKGKKRTKKGAV